MAKFPPEGCRGASLCRATDYGRKFTAYFRNHNADVLVIVMLEHFDAVQNVDAILAMPGVDGVFIGPYDLSASMQLPGLLDHPQVLAAQQTILDACRRHQAPAGIHALPGDPEQIRRYVEQGFRFIACGMDTELLLHGSRAMLQGLRKLSDAALITAPEFHKAEGVFCAARGLDVRSAPAEEEPLAAAVRRASCRAVVVGIEAYRGPLYEALGETGGARAASSPASASATTTSPSPWPSSIASP